MVAGFVGDDQHTYTAASRVGAQLRRHLKLREASRVETKNEVAVVLLEIKTCLATMDSPSSYGLLISGGRSIKRGLAGMTIQKTPNAC
ncbi:hypothetical protein MRX96_051887 [Rhipicephalus microplus]